AGSVVEQMADRDRVEALVELRQKLPRLVVDRKLSLVFELQDRRGGELFRQRSDRKHRIGARGNACLAVEQSVRAREREITFANGDRDSRNSIGDCRGRDRIGGRHGERLRRSNGAPCRAKGGGGAPGGEGRRGGAWGGM